MKTRGKTMAKKEELLLSIINLEEELDTLRRQVNELDDREVTYCCVNNPPPTTRDVYLLQDLTDYGYSAVTKNHKLAGWYAPSIDRWCIKVNFGGNQFSLKLPKEAFEGVRWCEINE